MKPTKNLIRLRVAASKNIARLRTSITHLPAASDEARTGNALLAVATIELQNAWSSFVRSYFLSGLLSARTERGHIIRTSATITSLAQGIGIAIHSWKPKTPAPPSGVWRRRDEPPWHDPTILLDLSNRLHFSNVATIQAALSMQSRTFVDLPVFRNFFAHRNQDSSRAALALAAQYSIAANRPSEVLLSRATGRPQVLILDWIDDIHTTIEMLCE
jgi:hypothetical protein